MADNAFFTGLSKAGSALGKGLMVGFAGTMAIILSQMIEMHITNVEKRKGNVNHMHSWLDFLLKGTMTNAA